MKRNKSEIEGLAAQEAKEEGKGELPDFTRDKGKNQPAREDSFEITDR